MAASEGRARTRRLAVGRLFTLAGVACLAAACLVFFMAAASSGSSTHEVTRLASHASTKCAKRGSTITIGAVDTLSGSLAVTIVPTEQAVQAWVKEVNASGGVNCHPVKYDVLDDDGNPAQNLVDTQQLVQQDHVVAFVGSTSPNAMPASEAYLASTNIPVVGSAAGFPFFYQHPNFFPEQSMDNTGTGKRDLGGDVYGILSVVGKAKHLTRVGLFNCQGVPVCTAVTDTGPAEAKSWGLKIVYLAQEPLTESDFTSICLAAKAANVQMAVIVNLGSEDVEEADQCATLGFHPAIYATHSPLFIPAMLTDPNLNGMVLDAFSALWFDKSLPSVKQYIQAIARYGGGSQPSQTSIDGWITAQLFQAATTNLPTTGKVTSAEIMKGLDSLKNDTLGGLTNPLTFTAHHDAPITNCFWSVKILNGHFVAGNKGLGTCNTPALTKELDAAE